MWQENEGNEAPPRPPKWLKIKWILIVLIVGLFLFDTIYQVSPEEVGVILRFGRFNRTAEPGLHMKLPFLFETLQKVPVQRQLKMEFGYRSAKDEVPTRYLVSPDASKEAVMLTGDLNVVVVEWIVQYKISDVYKYLFKMRDVNQTFRYMNEAVVRKSVGDNSVDEVLTTGRARIAAEAKKELQDLCALYEIGIDVNQLILQDVNPPDPVKPSFNEVNEALQEKERKINEAWSDYNQTVPKARGEAEQTIREAEGYALERVNRAQGDIELFNAIHTEYARAPLVTRKRLYLETLSEVFSKSPRKVIVDEKLKAPLPFLNLKEEDKP